MTKLQLIERYLRELDIHPSRHAQVTVSLLKRSKGFLERYVASQVKIFGKDS